MTSIEPSKTNRWREKVFALLVQIKSESIIHQQEKSKLSRNIQELEQRIKDLSNSLLVQKQKEVDLTAKLEINSSKYNVSRALNAIGRQ